MPTGSAARPPRGILEGTLPRTYTRWQSYEPDVRALWERENEPGERGERGELRKQRKPGWFYFEALRQIKPELLGSSLDGFKSYFNEKFTKWDRDRSNTDGEPLTLWERGLRPDLAAGNFAPTQSSQANKSKDEVLYSDVSRELVLHPPYQQTQHIQEQAPLSAGNENNPGQSNQLLHIGVDQSLFPDHDWFKEAMAQANAIPAYETLDDSENCFSKNTNWNSALSAEHTVPFSLYIPPPASNLVNDMAINTLPLPSLAHARQTPGTSVLPQSSPQSRPWKEQVPKMGLGGRSKRYEIPLYKMHPRQYHCSTFTVDDIDKQCSKCYVSGVHLQAGQLSVSNEGDMERFCGSMTRDGNLGLLDRYNNSVIHHYASSGLARFRPLKVLINHYSAVVGNQAKLEDTLCQENNFGGTFLQYLILKSFREGEIRQLVEYFIPVGGIRLFCQRRDISARNILHAFLDQQLRPDQLLEIISVFDLETQADRVLVEQNQLRSRDRYGLDTVYRLEAQLNKLRKMKNRQSGVEKKVYELIQATKKAVPVEASTHCQSFTKPPHRDILCETAEGNCILQLLSQSSEMFACHPEQQVLLLEEILDTPIYDAHFRQHKGIDVNNPNIKGDPPLTTVIRAISAQRRAREAWNPADTIQKISSGFGLRPDHKLDALFSRIEDSLRRSTNYDRVCLNIQDQMIDISTITFDTYLKHIFCPAVSSPSSTDLWREAIAVESYSIQDTDLNRFLHSVNESLRRTKLLNYIQETMFSWSLGGTNTISEYLAKIRETNDSKIQYEVQYGMTLLVPVNTLVPIPSGCWTDSDNRYEGYSPRWHRSDPASNGGREVVTIFKNNGANANQKGHGGLAPLHTAAGGGLLDVVPDLLYFGANPNARDDYGRSVIAYARDCLPSDQESDLYNDIVLCIERVRDYGGKDQATDEDEFCFWNRMNT